MADIKFTVIVDTATGQTQIKQFDQDVKNLGESGEKSAGLFGKLTGNIAVGIATYHAASRAMSGMIGFMKDCINGAIDQEKADSALTSTLQITGREIETNKKHYIDYATQLQAATLYTDEQVEASQTLLLQLTNLDQKGMDAAERGAIGLASVLKIDLQSATMMVAKAMEGNFQALGRYGIKVQQTGDLEKDRATLLEKLGSMYKRAEDEVNTFGGRLTNLDKSFDELKETIGTTITGSDAFKKEIKDLKEWVDKLAKSDDFKLWLNTVIQGLIEAIKFAGKFEKAIENITTFLAKGNKANKEYTDANKKLQESLDRAAAAGHDFRTKIQNITEEAEKLNPKINETGNVISDVKKRTEELTATFLPLGHSLSETNKTFVFAYASVQGYGKVVDTAVGKTRTFSDEVLKDAGIIKKVQKSMAEAWRDDYQKSIEPTYEKWGDLLEKNYGYIADYCIRTDQAFDSMKTNLGDTFVQIGLGHKSLFEGMGLVMTNYANEIGGAMRKMAMDAIMEVSRQWIADKMSALSSLIKSVMKLPFPFNIAAVGGAIALVTALFAKIRAFEEGGIVVRPTMGMIGERGPEAVIPLNQQTINNYFGRQGAARGSQIINLDVYLGSELFERQVLKIVERNSDLGNLRINPKVIRTR